MRRPVVGSVQCLLGLEDRLNELDARVGDGDTGSTLAIGAKAILQFIDDLPLADAPDLCQAMSDVLAGSMGGSSGVLLSIFLTSIGRAYAQTGAWPKALESGIASLQTYGGAAVGDRTMIDALVPANKALLAGEGSPARRKWRVRVPRQRRDGSCGSRPFLLPERALADRCT